ncbi:isochorismatase family protein [Sphingosinicella xenopeptidilytica]|uniref:Isochorismatase family protein n=1 Tax=Sphingosinicella xenopeptidilytica TaxID=364098 RepID=A0ABW3C7K6_SPHXN
MTQAEVYNRQGFGQSLQLRPPFGLLIVDFVNGFADPDQFGGENISEAIRNTITLLRVARIREWPCAFSRIVFADDDADSGVFGRKVPSLLALKENTPASAIVDDLAPISGELVVRKTVPSAFFGTNLAPFLIERGVKSLVVAGAVTSGCVRASVVDAMSWGFQPIVLSDCVGDRAIEPHKASLFDIEQKYGEVLQLAEFLKRTEMGAG